MMAYRINELAAQGWVMKSNTVLPQGYDFGRTCCLGCLFLPLALLGRNKNLIQVVMERDVR